jgi:tetratricopeptide (TPR) repeat protein
VSSLKNLLEEKRLVGRGKALLKVLDGLKEKLSEEGVSSKDTAPIKRELTKVYWEVLEQIIQNGLNQSVDTFSKEERLLLDFGYIDGALLHGELADGKNEEELQKTLYNLHKPGDHDQEPIYYLSEWVLGWDLSNSLFGFGEGEVGEDTQLVEEGADEQKMKLLKMRQEIDVKLLPHYRKLPGVNDQFLRNLVSGEFDRNVELITLALKDNPDEISVAQSRVLAFHRTLFKQAEAIIDDPKLKKLLVLREKLFRSLLQLRSKDAKSIENEEKKKNEKESKLQGEMVKKELMLIKSLLPIGGMAGKVFQTSPILEELKYPIGKTFVGQWMQRIRACDPYIPEELSVVIVPYKGGGFFEWDKNTLIVPLTPSVPKEEAVIRAVASYRILMDKLENEGRLKQLYEKQFEKGTFKERFFKDYTQWVTHVGQGHRRIMNDRKIDFFMEHVGPSEDKLFAPNKYMHLSAFQLRRRIRDVTAQVEISQEEYLELGCCFFILKEYKKAEYYLDLALSSGRPSALVLLSRGMVYRSLSDAKMAQNAFRQCSKVFKDSIHGVYASRLLDKK